MKIHIEYSIFSQNKNHFDQRLKLNQFWPNTAFLYPLQISQNQNFP